MPSAPPQRRWQQGDDAAVKQRLVRERERLGSADAFASLGLGPEAREGDVRAAYLRATKEYHPNRFARRDADTRRLANEVFLHIKDAYRQLETAEGRARTRGRLGRAATARTPEADAPEATPRAEQKAPSRPAGARPRRRRSRVRRRPRAPTRPQRAASPSAEETEAALEAALDLARRRAWDDARHAFQKLAVSDPKTKKYRVWMHYAWGRDHESVGRADEARAEYRRSLQLDPEFDRARRALDDLGDDTRAKRGFFSRLFGKS